MEVDELLLIAKKQLTGVRTEDLAGITLTRNVDTLGRTKFVIDLTFKEEEILETTTYYGE